MRRMATLEHSTTDRRAARVLACLLVGLGGLAVSMLFVLTSPLSDQDGVASRKELASVDLGMPMPWLHQDQSGYDPPLPDQLGPASPWENPTSISLGVLLADVAMVFVILTLVLWLLAAAISTATSSRRA